MSESAEKAPEGAQLEGKTAEGGNLAKDLAHAGAGEGEQARQPENRADQGEGEQRKTGDGQKDGPAGDESGEDGKDKAKGDAARDGEDASFDNFTVEGADPAIVSQFAEFARGIGISPGQAKELAAWQMKLVEEGRSAARAAGAELLTKEWGADAAKNARQVMGLVESADQKMDGAFSRALERLGANDDADFLKGLYIISGMAGEDRISQSLGGSGGEAESPEKALQEVWEKQQGRR